MAGGSGAPRGENASASAGSGGVGKTTSSAAIAAGMAARGKKVAVLTIDPAKRLADSLGLPELGNEERRVDPTLFAEARVDTNGGELWAMMLDAKATFDDLVRRHAPDEETRDRILQSRIYQQLSAALAGSQEYMAMEKLFELHAENRYDLLVLDTPPTRNALDFLDAPKRLMQFIEGRALQVFMRPTGFANACLRPRYLDDVLRPSTDHRSRGARGPVGVFQAFSGMLDGFRERARRVSELLANPATCFLVVCAPQGEPVSEAVYFDRKLVEAKLPFGGVIVNRVHYESELPEYDDEFRSGWHRPLATTTWRGAPWRTTTTTGTGRPDRHNIERLTAEMRARAVIQVPYLDTDVHDLSGLMQLNEYLFAAGPRERTEIASA